MTPERRKLWDAAVAEYERLAKEKGLRPFVRGAGYWHTDGESVQMIAKFYQGTTKLVYVFGAYKTYKGSIATTIEGPYEDSSDDYWNEMKGRDAIAGDALVVEVRGERYHYTIHRDSVKPGPGDGHGGGLFRFEIYDSVTALRLQEKGLRVTRVDTTWILESRNVWSQDMIPKKHWDKFLVNAALQK